jgi:hypothetical protein
MSAHVEYWGIPSPAEERYCTRNTDIPLDRGETAFADGSRLSVLNIEHWGEDANLLPNRLSGLVSFLTGERVWPDKLTK